MARICLTIADVTRTGGEERMCCVLANALAARGHEVMIVSQNAYYWKKGLFELDRRICRRSMKYTLLEWAICHFLPRLRYDTLKYRYLLKSWRTDVIIDVDTEMSLVSTFAARGLDVKIISWEHFCYQRFSSRDISREILDCIRDRVDKLVVLTKADYRCFIEESHIPAEKVCQIYNPSPIEKNEYIPHEGQTVLSMGRMMPEKGYDMLLKAWSLIEDSCVGWSLEIVGEGPLKDSLLTLIGELGLKRARILPFTDNPEARYRSASIYAMSSTHEGFPLVLLEAANMSLPIVSFDCNNGPREIVKDGENGFLITPQDVEELAAKIKELISNEQLREQISRNALDSVSSFRMDKIVLQWEDLISSIER